MATGFGKAVRRHFGDSRPLWGGLESGDDRPFDVIQAIRKRYTDMLSVLDERGRRLFVAAEARAYGLGGAYVVEQGTGVARSTINRGISELKPNPPPTGRVRRVGGGRKKKRPNTPPSSTI